MKRGLLMMALSPMIFLSLSACGKSPASFSSSLSETPASSASSEASSSEASSSASFVSSSMEKMKGYLLFDPLEMTVFYGTFTQLACMAYPAAEAVPAFFSDNPSVAAIDPSGVLTAVGIGEATITAALDGYHSARCRITAEPLLTLNCGSALSVVKQTAYQLSVTSNPPLKKDDAYSFFSSDESVASIDSLGVIFAKRIGQAVISVYCTNGGYASLPLTVY